MLETKILKLREGIVEYARLVEDMIEKSIKGLIERKKELLLEVIKIEEDKANKYEIMIDELCINIIAQYGPKAKDLRTVLMILKMNNDLERIADHAVNISQSASYLLEHPLGINGDIVENISNMVKITKKMLDDSIIAFINNDSCLARMVCKNDSVIDNLKYEFYKRLIDFMSSNPNLIESSLNIMRIINNLERIADLATNICEEVIFISEGKVIKHHFEDN